METSINVSVIVASYRRDNELDRALSSLGNQTFRNFEVILVDDNADSDFNCRVEKIVDSFRKKYTDINISF